MKGVAATGTRWRAARAHPLPLNLSPAHLHPLVRRYFTGHLASVQYVWQCAPAFEGRFPLDRETKNIIDPTRTSQDAVGRTGLTFDRPADA